MIRLTHVSQRYGSQVALDDVNFEVNAGDFCVVLGPSGAGKTSLLRLLTMEALPTSGQVQVGSFVSGRLGRGQRAELRRTLGVVFEDFKLLEDRNLFENVALALRIHGVWDRPTLERRVDEALGQVGLPAARTPSRASSPPGRSSAPPSRARSQWPVRCSPTSRPPIWAPARRSSTRCSRPTRGRHHPPGHEQPGRRRPAAAAASAGRDAPARSRRRRAMGRLSYLLREAWRGLWHHRSLTFTAFLALVGALLGPACSRRARERVVGRDTLGDRREMLVFLHDDIADSTKQDVEPTWLAVRQITYVSKDEAWDESRGSWAATSCSGP